MKVTEQMKEKIFIKTNHIGFIPVLGIQGPIVNPYPTTRAVAKELLVSGIQVFEIKPDKSVVELNLQNVFPNEGNVVREKPKKESKPIPKPVEPVTFKGVEVEKKEEPVVAAAPVEEKVEEVKEEEPKEEVKKDYSSNNYKKNKHNKK